MSLLTIPQRFPCDVKPSTSEADKYRLQETMESVKITVHKSKPLLTLTTLRKKVGAISKVLTTNSQEKRTHLPSSYENVHGHKFLRVPRAGYRYVNYFKDWLFFLNVYVMCMYNVMCSCMSYMHQLHAGAWGNPKRESDSLELGLEAVVCFALWVLGTWSTLTTEPSLQTLKYVNSTSTFTLRYKWNKISTRKSLSLISAS